MAVPKLAGPGAGVRKYDLLTALAVAGLAGSPSFSTSMTRLIALITARYNWRLDEVSIGQAELARLWSVDLRTVKREIKRLREHGILVVKRAGVRGRVSTYRLDHTCIDAMTESTWPHVGPDFHERMLTTRGRALLSPGAEMEADDAGTTNTVVSFPKRSAAEADSRTEWGRARQFLKQADPALYNAWFAPLSRLGVADGVLLLRAPTEFHRNYVATHLLGDVIRAVTHASGKVQTVQVLAD